MLSYCIIAFCVFIVTKFQQFFFKFRKIIKKILKAKKREKKVHEVIVLICYNG